jgi:hypothetical protein
MSYIGNEPTSVAFLTDTFSGNGSTTAFTLSAAPAGTSSILVAITGVVQDPSTYSVVGTTLTFSPAPPTGTGNISVRFLGIPASGVTTTAYRTVTEFTATAGQTTFNTPSYTPGFIDVYQNGVMLGSADYTASNGLTVVLAIGANVGDLVEVISFQVSSILNAMPTTGGTFSGNVLFDSGDGIWNTSGNVGVGTTTPKVRLSGKVLSINNTSAGDNYQSSLELLNNGVSAGEIWANSGEMVIGAYSPGRMAFRTQNVERMAIDSSGRVTAPSQPAFRARRGSNWTKTGAGTQPVPFDTAITNIGNNYNTSNYRFTAPVAGMYHFETTVGTDSGGSSMSYYGVIFTVNNSTVLDGWNKQETGGYMTDTKSISIYLNQNDFVIIILEASATITATPNQTNFSGYLIG